MDRCCDSLGKSQRRESQKEDWRARKGTKVARKVANWYVFCQCFLALKRRVRSYLAGWDQKMHAAAPSTFRSIVKNTLDFWRLERFLKLSCWKSARGCGAKHISKSTGSKHTTFGSTFGRWTVIFRSRCSGFLHFHKKEPNARVFCSTFHPLKWRDR